MEAPGGRVVLLDTNGADRALGSLVGAAFCRPDGRVDVTLDNAARPPVAVDLRRLRAGTPRMGEDQGAGRQGGIS